MHRSHAHLDLGFVMHVAVNPCPFLFRGLCISLKRSRSVRVMLRLSQYSGRDGHCLHRFETRNWVWWRRRWFGWPASQPTSRLAAQLPLGKTKGSQFAVYIKQAVGGFSTCSSTMQIRALFRGSNCRGLLRYWSPVSHPHSCPWPRRVCVLGTFKLHSCSAAPHPPRKSDWRDRGHDHSLWQLGIPARLYFTWPIDLQIARGMYGSVFM